MADRITIKQGELFPYPLTLLDRNKRPVLLNGTTVTFTMRSLDGTQVLFNAQAVTITDALNGQVRLPAIPADAPLGVYRADFAAFYTAQTQPEYFPDGDYLLISVIAPA